MPRFTGIVAASRSSLPFISFETYLDKLECDLFPFNDYFLDSAYDVIVEWFLFLPFLFVSGSIISKLKSF